MNESSEHELRSLRQRLRHMRYKQDKPKTRKVQYRSGRPRTASDVATTPPSSTEFTAGETLKKLRERKREVRSRRAKSVEARSSDLRSMKSSEKSYDRGHRSNGSSEEHSKKSSRTERSKKTSRSSHVPEQPSRVESSQRRSSRRSSKTSEESSLKHESSRKQPTHKRRTRQSVDESEYESPKLTGQSRLKSTDAPQIHTRPSSTRRKPNLRSVDVSEEGSLKPSERRHSYQSEEGSPKKDTPRRHSHDSSLNQSEPRLDLRSIDEAELRERERIGYGAVANDDDDASLCSVDTYWGERYFELQSQFTAQEAIEMLREEQEMMKEVEEEKLQLERDMEEAKQEREILRQKLSQQKHMDEAASKQYDADDASQVTWDDKSVSTMASHSTCRSIASSIFKRRSSFGSRNQKEQHFNSTLKSSVKKWCDNAFPELQEEATNDLEQKQQKMMLDLQDARKERDRLSRQLAMRTQSNAKLAQQLKMANGDTCSTSLSLENTTINQDDDSASISTWNDWRDDQSVSTMASQSTCRSFISSVFHVRLGPTNDEKERLATSSQTRSTTTTSTASSSDYSRRRRELAALSA